MDINITSVGQFIFINIIVTMFLTLKFARGNTNNLLLAGFYSFLLNLLFFPASWLYCWYWSRKHNAKVNDSPCD
ncbi:hypothetical protein EMK97_10100 [Litorilituus sediminis]|uniref:Uncharacterized protein n=1 Tax=Litorilituus sediminis TaxID=718192 RepID=A0A4P6P3V9_9GAMM|nr:hypothetical protein EMK97_10100 [Litorilituus sediminis]